MGDLGSMGHFSGMGHLRLGQFLFRSMGNIRSMGNVGSMGNIRGLGNQRRMGNQHDRRKRKPARKWRTVESVIERTHPRSKVFMPARTSPSADSIFMRAPFAAPDTNPTAKKWQANVSHMSKQEKVGSRRSRNRFLRDATQESAPGSGRERSMVPKYRPTHGGSHRLLG